MLSDWSARRVTGRGLVRDFIIPAVILESCIVLFCYGMANGSLPQISPRIPGILFGVVLGASLSGSPDRGRLRLFANTIAGFRVGGFLVSRYVVWMFIGTLALLPTWLPWHAWDCMCFVKLVSAVGGW